MVGGPAAGSSGPTLLRPMPVIPLKPQYGPTLGQMLAPRWHAASRPVRAAVVALGFALVALLVGAVLTLEDAHLSYHGPVSFNFLYKDLYRVRPDRGGYAKVERGSGVRFGESFAVEPLTLPAYSGNVSGELPLYAAGYTQHLADTYPDFDLQGEGKTRVNGVAAYSVYYTAVADGATIYGRDILVPNQSGARVGVVIVMHAAPGQDMSPGTLGGSGVLLQPLRTFSFGS
jgi:hypothetical protein